MQGNQDLRARLTAGTVAARLGRTTSPEKALQDVAAQAGRAGLLDVRLEADLALAERAARQDGGARLAALQKEAQSLGYGAIARRAGASSSRSP